MSALSEALPLALSASIYPPALLVLILLLTGEHPRRPVLAYFAGAALMVVVAGLVALVVLKGSGATGPTPARRDDRGRRLRSQKWSFVLGLAMFLPSPLYLLAVQKIADSGSSTSSNVAAVLICAAGVLIFVEITVLALFVRPGSVAAGLDRTQVWIANNSWTLGSLVAFAAAVYARVEGVDALS